MTDVHRLVPGSRRAFARRFAALLLLSSGAATLVGAGPARADDYPNRPVRVLVGFPPGQATDVLARMVSQRLADRLGQPFVVENKAGAAGIIATEMAMKAPADGYTLLVSSSGPLTVNPSMYAKLPYDTLRDFVPIAGLGSVPLVLVANPSFAPNTVTELVKAAKEKPGRINYASGGNGVTNHLVMEMFKHAADIRMVHIPYKGGPAALNDLIGGQVDVMFETALAALPFVKQGKLKALAVSSETRAPAAPELPTIAESGYKGFSGVPWVAMVAPMGTPKAIVDKLNAEIVAMMKLPEVQKQLETMGTQPMLYSPSETDAFIRSEMAKWKEAVKLSGAKIE